ncbi:MAG: terminase large subunit [Candidatus Sulfotelmatobacter sp.]
MSHRETNTRRNLTAAEETLRKKQLAKAPELGVPLCPEQFAYNNRRLWAIWKKNVGHLLERRLLSFADGDALLTLCRAELNAQTEVMQAVFDATWKNRTPFPAPAEAPSGSLSAFLKDVERERETFQKRMRPSTTIALDDGDLEYSWPEEDVATVARKYAVDVVQGGIVAGELIRRAATRFLTDLETAHERGLFFDPVAARHIVFFSETFCDLKLLPWQVFVLANIFGWKKPSGTRRFTEAWVSCAKKNGKTRLASSVALFTLVADCEKYPDIFSAATKKEQSKLVWRDAKRCVNDNPELREHVQRWAGALMVKDTDGSFTPLSSDEKSMDGLRPHVIIADEVAFWSDRDQWDKLVKGVVSRIQPLTFAVTTAGSSKQCFAFGKFDLGEKILRGIYNDDSTFVAIFAIDKDDDPLDEKCWPKANPSLGVTLQVEHLKKTAAEAREVPSGLSSFIQYHANQWPDVSLQRLGSIPAAKWDACKGLDLIGCANACDAYIKFLNLNRDIPCWLGIDVGLTSDLSAIAMLWRKARFAEGADPIDKTVLIVFCYAPELYLLEKEKSWGVPLSQWAREEFLELFPGDLCDPRELKKRIVDILGKFNVRELGFDTWNAQVMCAELSESGAVQCVAVPQTAKELTAPAREFLGAIHRQELVHFGNPCLSWMSGNVILAEDEKHGGTKPEKLSANEKIDGVSATLNAWHRMLADPNAGYVPRMSFIYEDGSMKRTDSEGKLI